MAYTIDELKDAYKQGCLFTEEGCLVKILEWDDDGYITGAIKYTGKWMVLGWCSNGEYCYSCEGVTFFDLKIKESTVMIGDKEVHAPESGALDNGTKYYIPNIKCSAKYESYIWDFTYDDIRYLANGLIHLSPEHAIEHTEAILSFTKRIRD